jgi:hypothetical protein
MNNPRYKLFVPDVEKWTRFYMLQAQGKLEPAFRLQRGGRWQTMRSVDRCLELYDPEWKQSRENKKSDQPKIVMASETQQIVEQAKARQAMEVKATQKRQRQIIKNDTDNVQDGTARKKKKIPRFVL